MKCCLLQLSGVFSLLGILLNIGKIATAIIQMQVQNLTCAFLQATGPFSMHPQLTVEVFLPELGEPNISSVVGQ